MDENEPKISQEKVTGPLANYVTERMQRGMAKASEENKELQRRKGLSSDTKSREAIDRLANNLKDFAGRQGKEMTNDQAHREAVKIAHSAERKRDA